MSKSSIEWTGYTWNPTKGCSIKSPGCKNCFAMREAYRFGFNPQLPIYHGLTKLVNGKPIWTGKIVLAPDSTLLQPLKRKKPTTYFVNSMSDLFHEDIPDEWIDRVFAVMALTPQHTYQILTKRADRMREYLAKRPIFRICGAIGELIESVNLQKRFLDGNNKDHWTNDGNSKISQFPWPLPNVWLGISCERQQEADERIPHLLNTPAAIRFISAEPLLGPIDLTALTLPGVTSKFDALKHGATYSRKPDGHRFYHISGQPTLDWVIAGGESGPNARPMHPDWARSLRNQCNAANVPFFFKQWGNWRPEIDRDRDDPDWRQPYAKYREPAFQILNLAGGQGFHGERVHVMRNCSKASAGRALDGMIHDEFPEAARG